MGANMAIINLNGDFSFDSGQGCGGEYAASRQTIASGIHKQKIDVFSQLQQLGIRLCLFDAFGYGHQHSCLMTVYTKLRMPSEFNDPNS